MTALAQKEGDILPGAAGHHHAFRGCKSALPVKAYFAQQDQKSN